MTRMLDTLYEIAESHELTERHIAALVDCNDQSNLMRVAGKIRDRGHGSTVSYSKKVFIPLTKLCRDSCHYCTFARAPSGHAAYLTLDEVIGIAKAGADAGCTEALFTLGDKPEDRYRAARDALHELGADSTLSYLKTAAALVLRETGLLPHLNPGVMNRDELESLRTVSVSQGIMLETASERLGLRGGPHFGSPDKVPAVRLEVIRQAGECGIPFTTGILVGIGETRRERIEALVALRDLHRRYGHLQEIIIQNFRPKAGTKMASVPALDPAEHLWTVSVARLLFGEQMNIQAPPNLSGSHLADLIAAGINDWGGVSPVTPDHVNPEAPWPALRDLQQRTEEAGKVLVGRLAIYPEYVKDPSRWLDPALRTAVLHLSDSEGYAREDSWVAGASKQLPEHNHPKRLHRRVADMQAILGRLEGGAEATEQDIVRLFAARGPEFDHVCEAADTLRKEVNGDTVTYVINRNINYTNICSFHCKFCAFSKGKLSAHLRGRPYDLSLEEIQRRSKEAWDRGATEVCLQGGIHPDYTGETYLSICRAIKRVAPDMHIHAFSPLEVWQGAATIGVPVEQFLVQLKEAGLGSLPGTAAEILDDEIRAIICPDKLKTDEWLRVIESAHAVGLRTTSTIMYGHVDGPINWARHLLRLRASQKRTGGLTEFVPLPFVPMETPIYLHGRARRGPTYREAVLMHAIARLALHPYVTNIQASWVKMGPDGLKVCLQAGANDAGGSLMNESITRAAGATHGQELGPEAMDEIIRSVGRVPRQRTTLYGPTLREQQRKSYGAARLLEAFTTA